jgi:hypothetical protein
MKADSPFAQSRSALASTLLSEERAPRRAMEVPFRPAIKEAETKNGGLGASTWVT